MIATLKAGSLMKNLTQQPQVAFLLTCTILRQKSFYPAFQHSLYIIYEKVSILKI